jgi:hypothetical protein
MKVRVKSNTGFRPVTVRISFDNAVEYACFKTMIGAYDSLEAKDSIPYKIAAGYTGLITAMSGVILSGNEVEGCLKGIMKRIYNKLPSSVRRDY